MSWKNDIGRRKFLSSLGVTAALPFLESIASPRAAQAQPNKLIKRLIIVSQPHMALGYHRIPEMAKGAFGAGDPSIVQVDAARGMRFAPFGTTPGKLGGFYEQAAFKNSPRLQQELMSVNGLAMTYAGAQGHQSDGNGSWSGGGQGGKLNTRARFPLSGSLHTPMVTIDHVIARKIHKPGQRIMFMGNSRWGGGGADTDESVDFNGAIQSLAGSTANIYNGPIFEAGKKVTEGPQRTGGMTPTAPADPLANLSNDNFASLMGLRFNQEQRKRLLADGRLSNNDKRALEQYYDLLNETLKTSEAAAQKGGAGMPGQTVSAQCAPMTAHGGDMAAFNRMLGVAFLCDLSRIGFTSQGSYLDHNSVWHSGAGGNPGLVNVFNTLANQMSQIATFLTTLTDPETGRDMLETTLVLGITNCALSIGSDGRDSSHSYHDFGYVSVGGSIALKTGHWYDFMGWNNGKRPAVNGPVPAVNQYLQTIAAAFGCTSADWSPAGGKGFGPWLSNVCVGRQVRADDAAKTQPIPGLLKT